jgi:hypothetical protein
MDTSRSLHIAGRRNENSQLVLTYRTSEGDQASALVFLGFHNGRSLEETVFDTELSKSIGLQEVESCGDCALASVWVVKDKYIPFQNRFND